MGTANELLKLFESSPITRQQLKSVESVLDTLFSSLNIDVEFTKHFFDRLNDDRNGKQISIDELVKLYSEEYERYGVRLSKLPDGLDALLADASTNINVPVLMQYNKQSGKIEMIAKTVMRTKTFHTRSKKFFVK